MKIIGFAGRAGTGKTTLACALAEVFGSLEKYACVRSFADPIREMVAELQIHVDTQTELLVKDSVIFNGVTVRTALQTLGTEWGRKVFGPDIWVACMRNEISMAEQAGVEYFIIDDVRFPNEVEMIQSLGGTVFALYREGYDPAPSAHASEAFDAVAEMRDVEGYTLYETPEHEAATLAAHLEGRL